MQLQKGQIYSHKNPDCKCFRCTGDNGNYKGGKITKTCHFCKKEFLVWPYRGNSALFCSLSCKAKSRTGTLAYHWKGGKQRTGNGYIHIVVPNHPFTDKRGRIYEHRIIMEKYLKRYLTSKEVVDHINGIKTDNRIGNLRLFKSNGEHLSKTYGKNWINK